VKEEMKKEEAEPQIMKEDDKNNNSPTQDKIE